MKFISIGTLWPLGAYFVPEPWQFFAGVYPGYWAAKVYWAAQVEESHWLLYSLLGLVSAVPWIAVFVRHYLKRAGI